MKKLVLVFASLLINLVSYSQYVRTLINKSVWYEYYYFESSSNEQNIVSGDTTINDTAYKIINRIYQDTLFLHNRYFREDTINKRIFERDYYGKETLWYDYNLNIGDTFRFPYNSEKMILDSISHRLKTQKVLFGDFVEIDFPSRKIFYFHSRFGANDLVWIEGIGSTEGFCNELHMGYNLLCHFDSTGLMDLHLNNDSTCYGPDYYGVDNFLEEGILVFPNPTNGVISIETPEFEKVEIYSASGKRLIVTDQKTLNLKSFPNGLYIFKLYLGKNIIISKIIKQ